MRIRMKETKIGSNSGFDIQRYKEGEVYEVSDALSTLFINGGHAVREPGDTKPDKNHGMTEYEKKRLDDLRAKGIKNMNDDEIGEFQRLAELGIRERFGGERLFILGND